MLIRGSAYVRTGFCVLLGLYDCHLPHQEGISSQIRVQNFTVGFCMLLGVMLRPQATS